jgi:hypothetical protein
MTGHGREITIDGIVQSESLDAILLAHKLSIVAEDGHVYEVEPRFVGAYLRHCIGLRVNARAEVILEGQHRSIVRILSLTLIGEPSADVVQVSAGARTPPAGPGLVPKVGKTNSRGTGR